jgi:SAM-dependent methyltransferase
MRSIIKKVIRIAFTPFILGDYFAFKKKAAGKDLRFHLSLSDANPRIFDKTATTRFDRHYIYHTAWAARKVAEIKPEFHTDISSSLYFAGIVSAFVPVKFYDYRPAELGLSGLSAGHADLTALPFGDNSVRSLSCMHTVEHVGLGRYGDAIDPEGDIAAIKELKRVLAHGGSLLFVVPVGKPNIQFNAHRIYSYNMILKYFSGLELKEFSLIPEKKGGMVVNAGKELADKEEYGCGCFWFIKK